MSQSNPFEGRWKWWYSAIADCMIRHPEWELRDIAKHLDKHPNTISLIARTDVFKTYLAQRKDEWKQTHDFSLASKLNDVAEKGLGAISDILDKQKDKVPMKFLQEVTLGALDRLGYAPNQTPGVQVNNYNAVTSQPVVVPVPMAALEEARDALRLAERRRGETLLIPVGQMGEGAGLGSDAPVVDVEVISDPTAPTTQ